MSTKTDTLTPQQRLAIVRHLANGKPLDVVATIANIPRDQVLDIGSHHGYPDRDKLAWAADILAKKIDEQAAALPEKAPDRAPTLIRPAAAASTPTAAGPPTTAPVQLEKPDEFRILINTAKGMPSKRIQALANRILDDTAKLRGLIQAEQDKIAARQQVTAEKAKARAEVERLEKQLVEAKAKLRGQQATTTPAEKPPASTAPKGEHPCRNDGCDRIFDTGQGRSLHERMKCEHRSQAAS